MRQIHKACRNKDEVTKTLFYLSWKLSYWKKSWITDAVRTAFRDNHKNKKTLFYLSNIQELPYYN